MGNKAQTPKTEETAVVTPTETPETVAETKPAKANNTVANLDAVKKLDKITDDGKKHKQGDVIKLKAFGVTIETKF